MALMPIFPIRLVLMFVLPVAVAAAVLGMAYSRGVNVFKKQGVAWALTLLMVFAAVGIGYAKAPASNAPAPTALPGSLETAPPAAAGSYVWDNAKVLSDRTVRELDQRNEKLWEFCSVSIGVVTCNYGGDLGEYALQCAGDMGLGGYDMLVVLDISGDNYWLLQGNDIRRDFTDNDCTNFAYDCMERYFAAGDYDNAVLKLTLALEDWYRDYFD